jgi:hypothetical protein
MSESDRALDAYLLWEFLKQTVRGALERSPIDRDRILSSMALAKELTAGLSTDEKMKMVRLFSLFSQRARLLKEKRWSLEQYPVSRLGTVLPCVDDLPLEEIVKSFDHVACLAREQFAKAEISSRSVRYIRLLSRIADILQTSPVMVIEPGSEQRRPDVLREKGGESLSVFPAEGYIEDGNHRALALIFADSDRTTIPSCVGRPTT